MYNYDGVTALTLDTAGAAVLVVVAALYVTRWCPGVLPTLPTLSSDVTCHTPVISILTY